MFDSVLEACGCLGEMPLEEALEGAEEMAE